MSKVINVIPENLTLGIVILVLTALAFFRGRKILYVMLISFFPAVMLYQALTLWGPVASRLPDGFFSSEFNLRLGLFTVIYVFIFFIIQRVVGYEIRRRGVYKVLDSVFLSLGLVAESFILIYQTLLLPDFYNLSTAFTGFLASTSGTVVMLGIALFSLLYSSRA